jgi:hypothetical protein
MNVSHLLILSACGLLLSLATAMRWSRAWLAASLGGVLSALGAATFTLLSNGSWEWQSGFRIGGELCIFGWTASAPCSRPVGRPWAGGGQLFA